MGERADELKGKMKEGMGKVTGDRELEAEGRGEATMAKGARETKGAVKQTVGKVEEGVGELTGDPDTEARGATRRMKGDVDRAG